MCNFNPLSIMYRKIIIILLNFISLCIYSQNIADVQRNNNGYCRVYDVNNKQIASGYVGSSKDDFSFSNCIIVVRNSSGYTRVYDEKLKQIASGYCGNSSDTFNVVGCNIVVKSKSNYKRIFNKNLKQISSGY